MIADKENTTQIGATGEFSSGRSFALLSATYSEEQGLLEVVMQFTNLSGDGVNEYFWTLSMTNGGEKKTRIKEVLNDPLITVVQISGIKRLEEVTLLFAPKTYKSPDEIKDADTGEIILNRHNVRQGKIDAHRTKSEYLIDRLSGVKAALELKMTEAKKEIAALTEKTGNLRTELAALDSGKEFVTASELETIEKQKEENKSEIAKTSEEISLLQAEISDLRAQIAEAEGKVNELARNPVSG
jgi:cell division protein FtsB